MKRILIPATLFFVCSSFYSQEVISSAGRIFSSNGVNLSWTIGEPVIETIDDGNITLTQGYQQANLTISKVEENLSSSFSVFPNPTHNQFTIQAGDNLTSSISGQLFNFEGKLIKEISISEITTTVFLDELPQGVYLLNISENSKNNIYRIIKN